MQTEAQKTGLGLSIEAKGVEFRAGEGDRVFRMHHGAM